MRELPAKAADRRRRRAATLLITTVVGVGALTGGTAAQAAPRDNVQNARQCLNGGWRTRKTAEGKSFRNVRDGLFYALRGGQFAAAPSPTAAPPPSGGSE